MTQIKARRDTAVKWGQADPVLSDGELAWDKTNKMFKVGETNKKWSQLKYLFNKTLQQWNDLWAHLARSDNPHTVTAAQVGAYPTDGSVAAIMREAESTVLDNVGGAGGTNLPLNPIMYVSMADYAGDVTLSFSAGNLQGKPGTGFTMFIKAGTNTNVIGWSVYPGITTLVWEGDAQYLLDETPPGRVAVISGVFCFDGVLHLFVAGKDRSTGGYW